MTEQTTVQHLTAEDLAQRLRIPLWSIYELAKSGELPAMRIGRRLRFRLEAIEAWERQREQGGAA